MSVSLHALNKENGKLKNWLPLGYLNIDYRKTDKNRTWQFRVHELCIFSFPFSSKEEEKNLNKGNLY